MYYYHKFWIVKFSGGNVGFPYTTCEISETFFCYKTSKTTGDDLELLQKSNFTIRNVCYKIYLPHDKLIR